MHCGGYDGMIYMDLYWMNEYFVVVVNEENNVAAQDLSMVVSQIASHQKLLANSTRLEQLLANENQDSSATATNDL
jgi:hypothetical protein